MNKNNFVYVFMSLLVQLLCASIILIVVGFCFKFGWDVSTKMSQKRNEYICIQKHINAGVERRDIETENGTCWLTNN